MSKFIKTCHTCQMTGKPNQSLRPAPLCPIPAMGLLFKHLLIDCVGPLPPLKSGNTFLLTVMCQTTWYPAAFPLRKITTKAVVKALSQFITIFGIPGIIQSDRGTNFTSKMFGEILKQLRVRHQQSNCFLLLFSFHGYSFDLIIMFRCVSHYLFNFCSVWVQCRVLS